MKLGIFKFTTESTEDTEKKTTALETISVKTPDKRLAERLVALLDTWSAQGRPGRATLHAAADALLEWRVKENVPGLWARPPRMLGATLDDGWGHGIELILKFARVLGCDTHFLGMLRPIDSIVEACRKETPDILGLTVLQLDTEQALKDLRDRLSREIHRKIEVIAGGPVFTIDPDLAERVGIDVVARDAAQFIRLMLKTADAEKESA